MPFFTCMPSFVIVNGEACRIFFAQYRIQTWDSKDGFRKRFYAGWKGWMS
ncbi:hypothetical protein BHY07_11930 [Bacillus subtilis subsp. subtilis]|nr:hypothetical protein QU35_11950 [Bacillus subtilis subsp. subtilis str. 168]AIY97808.1 hypothetical protein QX56_11940 [Bacillus subtilis]AJE94882.1 hypothetical protein RP72_11830 [Bacillus subtilis subsp. subtilis]AKC47758.1 hypothetical protein O7A_11940 [Bacillus subtilis KCTC 1028 = ATCC 6051a]AMK72650.1 hypothetical protein AWV81_11210 [Bacillus subtilis subsp. natto]AOL27130.1 hypothetical protein BGM23_11275 [Bacillus sp. FJAT-14266]AOL29943.1 hypothetical protein BGM20_04575 [Alka